MKRLTALKVEREKRPGLYSDGLGLYLQVRSSGSKSWIFRYRAGKKLRDMGLGSVNAIGLAEARERAARYRNLRANGIDPIDDRRRQEAAQRADAARALTFEQCAAQFVDAHKAGWKNAKHAAQWTATLQTYAYPVLGPLPVASVDTPLVLKVLEPIWNDKTETATRVRGRIESILDWARVRGFRDGENPARWRGHLDHLLPKRSKVAAVKHHAALPYREIPAFMELLRAEPSLAARAMEFGVLTAARTGEVIGARWSEIDLEAKLWTIPPDRMKAGREHRVPLATRAVTILSEVPKDPDAEFVFPGGKANRPLSSMALLMLLRRMKRDDLTVHGFRSTFRDWAAEQTTFPAEVAEMALAHTVSDKVEAAYRRGDLFDKRRALATAWAAFCQSKPVRPRGASNTFASESVPDTQAQN
ncbi:tyrosine-type recombinase/integrase [Rhodoplanes azumiensis]|uniref:Tyrosine-type recombinase/integrase n=1 Tax=Rhodoplanes azumiensis TaxID=1897628 RepID=A0ABW5AFM3_9BRAD